MKLRGIGASNGAVVANIYYLQTLDLSVTKLCEQDSVVQTQRFNDARSQAQTELDALYVQALKTDANVAQVFEVHKMMLDDPDYVDGVTEQLNYGFNAEYAVKVTCDALKTMFANMDSEYMRERAADVLDVSNRVIRILKGLNETALQPQGKIVVVATDLLPSQTVKLDKNNVVGFVTKHGSNTSHSVILARTMGIPCVVGLGEQFDHIPQIGTIAIDGTSGEVVVAPDKQTIEEYNLKQQTFLQEKNSLEQYRGKQAITKHGHKVKVCSNIGGLDDVEHVIRNDSDGVGLFRSEFIYLQSNDFPTEQTQFEIYKQVLQSLAPLPVVIRTLDLGSDKQAPYFGIHDEDNPALGYRAIRICLKEQHIFVTQLRALLRASVFGNLCIMFPMISHLEQIQSIKQILRNVQDDLDKEGVSYSRDVQIGIMIETPAAVIMSDVFAKEVDFFSIGTNDLTQYSLAVDRMNPNIKELFDSGNTAILRMIELTARNAHANGIWVGICGESAANTKLTDFYMSIGIDELSVSPSSVLAVKKAVISSDK